MAACRQILRRKGSSIPIRRIGISGIRVDGRRVGIGRRRVGVRWRIGVGWRRIIVRSIGAKGIKREVEVRTMASTVVPVMAVMLPSHGGRGQKHQRHQHNRNSRHPFHKTPSFLVGAECARLALKMDWDCAEPIQFWQGRKGGFIGGQALRMAAGKDVSQQSISGATPARANDLTRLLADHFAPPALRLIPCRLSLRAAVVSGPLIGAVDNPDRMGISLFG